MKKLLLTILAVLLTATALFAQERPYTKREVYLEGTDYELHVYRLYGRLPGKTMLIIGGIQGDEPGGFLSADLYANLTLEKGNLIVIPRANLKSVILYDRGPDGDMNRRFVNGKAVDDMDQVVSVLKGLMKEADVFLNLHDGWGFHNPQYIDKWRNPTKFGQSIIIDGDTFTCSNGKKLDLRSVMDYALAETNLRITNPDYKLQGFNTRTEDPKTPFPGMKKSATYYALTQFCLPAFGIESSKNLPTLELKVLHHNFAVNAFMRYYDIVPEQPGIFLTKPELEYLVVNVNDKPTILKDGDTLRIEKGDLLEVTHIEANYDRGLSADIVGYGDLNDLAHRIQVTGDTRIVLRKDNMKMAQIQISTSAKAAPAKQKPKETPAESSIDPQASLVTTSFLFVVRVNGVLKTLPHGTLLPVKRGDILELIAGYSADGKDNYPLNLRGYVPPSVSANSGDDRGYKIPVGDNFYEKFSVEGDGVTYPVIAGETTDVKGEFSIRITD